MYILNFNLKIFTFAVATRLNGYVGGYGSLSDFEAELPILKLDDKVAEYVRRAMKNGSRVAC